MRCSQCGNTNRVMSYPPFCNLCRWWRPRVMVDRPGSPRYPVLMSTDHSSEPQEKLEDWARYHRPKDGQADRFQEVAEASLAFMSVINRCCPGSPDKTVAFRYARAARMWANSSIALEGTAADVPRPPRDPVEPLTPDAAPR